jgi:hypothetical protein
MTTKEFVPGLSFEVGLEHVANKWNPVIRRRHAPSNCCRPLKKGGKCHPLLMSIQPVLVAVVLNSRGAKTSKAMRLNRVLPIQKFIHRQRVTAAGFFQRKQTTAHGCNHFGFAPYHPSSRIGRWQIGDCQWAPIGADNIFDARTHRLAHLTLTHSTQHDETKLKLSLPYCA